MTGGHDDGRSIERWKDNRSEVSVTQDDGFLCKVAMQTRVSLPADQVYDLLTEEDNSRIFRSIKAITKRRVLEDNGRGKMLVEVEHLARWKFLWFGGTFSTHLYVHQDKPKRTVEFRLAKPGLMKDFKGTWRVAPSTQPEPSRPSFGPAAWLSSLQKFRPGSNPAMESTSASSIATLEQSLMPAIIPPPPLDRILKGIAAKQVQALVEDLNAEAQRINSRLRTADASSSRKRELQV